MQYQSKLKRKVLGTFFGVYIRIPSHSLEQIWQPLLPDPPKHAYPVITKILFNTNCPKQLVKPTQDHDE